MSALNPGDDDELQRLTAECPAAAAAAAAPPRDWASRPRQRLASSCSTWSPPPSPPPPPPPPSSDSVNAETTLKRLIVGVSLSSCVLLVSGSASSQLVLVSEGIHSLADAFFYIISLRLHYAKTSQRRYARADQPFGLRRLPVLGGFFSGCFLAISCLFITLETISRVIEMQMTSEHDHRAHTIATFVSGCFGLGVNLFALATHYQSGGQHGHSHGHSHSHGNGHSHAEDANIQGAILHALADLCTSGVVLSTGFVRLALHHRWYTIVDVAASSLIVGVLLASARSLLLTNSRILLQHSPVPIRPLCMRIEQIDGVHSVSKLQIWQLDDCDRLVGAAKVLCLREADVAETLRLVTKLLNEADVSDVTVQVEASCSPELAL